MKAYNLSIENLQDEKAEGEDILESKTKKQKIEGCSNCVKLKQEKNELTSQIEIKNHKILQLENKAKYVSVPNKSKIIKLLETAIGRESSKEVLVNIVIG